MLGKEISSEGPTRIYCSEQVNQFDFYGIT